MKILHICNWDYHGAGKVALRLHLGLKSIGVESKMLVSKRRSQDKDVVQLDSPILRRINNEIRNRLVLSKFNSRPKGLDLFTDCNSSYVISEHPLVQEADIINLHWIGRMVNYKEFFPNTANKPVIWTLPDMNSFTGGCHYSASCIKYETGCGSCPQLGSKDPDDLSRKIWQKKKKAYRGHNIHIVTPCKWLFDCARKSALLREFKISVIPGSIPSSVFTKQERGHSRKLLNLPQDKTLILFGAVYPIERKGLKYLLQALELLKGKIDTSNIALVIFGNFADILLKDIGIPVHPLGYIHDEPLLSCAYSAADMFVMPSLEEVFGQTCLESMACGTPVIGTNTGGTPDIIKPNKTGLLVEVRNAEDLTQKIEWMINHPKEREEMGENCRRLVEEEYTLEIQARRYLALYESILSDKLTNKPCAVRV